MCSAVLPGVIEGYFHVEVTRRDAELSQLGGKCHRSENLELRLSRVTVGMAQQSPAVCLKSESITRLGGPYNSGSPMYARPEKNTETERCASGTANPANSTAHHVPHSVSALDKTKMFLQLTQAGTEQCDHQARSHVHVFIRTLKNVIGHRGCVRIFPRGVRHGTLTDLSRWREPDQRCCTHEPFGHLPKWRISPHVSEKARFRL